MRQGSRFPLMDDGRWLFSWAGTYRFPLNNTDDPVQFLMFLLQHKPLAQASLGAFFHHQLLLFTSLLLFGARGNRGDTSFRYSQSSFSAQRLQNLGLGQTAFSGLVCLIRPSPVHASLQCTLLAACDCRSETETEGELRSDALAAQILRCRAVS